MKFLVVLAVAVACAAAVDVAPYVITEDHLAPILKSSYDSSPEGNFAYSYETGNRINAYAEGVLKNYNSEAPVLEIKGSYKYFSPDGTPIETTYVADEGGYRATGPHIPQIPELILRGLAYTAAHAPVVAEKPYYSENSYKP